MAHTKVRITFEPDSKEPSVFEREVEFTDLREPGGKEFLAQYLLSEVEREVRWGQHYSQLASVDSFVQPVKQTFRLEDLASGEYEDRINTREMWSEIGNTLLRVKRLLAQSQAWYEQELAQSSSQDPEAQNLAWYLHINKMDSFDHAAMSLGKVSDLAARLVFERLGASLLRNLDRSNPEWERNITWGNIRRSLADRSANPDVASLTDLEYAALLDIFDDFLSTDHGIRLWGYRVKFAHRITPSVDRPELYAHLESREKTPIKNAAGETTGWTAGFGGIPKTAEYSFPDLYEDAAQTLRHYVFMLERLKGISRFSPEAAASAARGA